MVRSWNVLDYAGRLSVTTLECALMNNTVEEFIARNIVTKL
jgi:hypothetical protein